MSVQTIWTNSNKPTGFTLVEVLVVISIIAVISVLAFPTVMSMFRLNLDSATREMASTIRDSYNAALITGKVYRVVYDLKKQTYWAESGPMDVLLDTPESKKTEEERKKFHKSDEKENEDVSGGFTTDKNITRGPKELPAGVEFQEIITEQGLEPIKEGFAYTHFFPHGITEQTIIHLTDTRGQKLSLIITALLGKSRIMNDHITKEAAFENRE